MRLVGPLGIWPFPILNFILQLLAFRQSVAVENVEEWEVVRDEEGLPKAIIVKRTVKRAS